MMKNKKIIVMFVLIIAFLLIMVSFTKATDGVGNLIVEPVGNTETPTNESSNNEAAGGNNTAPIVNTNTNTNTGANGNNTTLPQTGVEENATLFIFIVICIASAIYAYIKIRKYNHID